MTLGGSPEPAVRRYWQASDREGVREYPAMHEGEGTIRVRSFFEGVIRMGVHFDVWELPPGATEGRHMHRSDDPKDDWEEFYYVVHGRGVAIFEHEEVELGPGDALLVPPDVDHGLANRGQEDLRIVLVIGKPGPP